MNVILLSFPLFIKKKLSTQPTMSWSIVSLITSITTVYSQSIFNGSEPSQYILDFPTGDNPLNITVISPPNMNYFMTIGDWGAPNGESTYQGVQKVVASKMNAYYESQAEKGYNLLFVAAVGDNYYWTGQDCNLYEQDWINVYGKNLTSIPWLAVMGNHDWGNSDPQALCAWNKPKYTSPAGIPYAANQLNKDKGGCNPSMFYMPDFAYYYTINELNFELIALDENAGDCPGNLCINYLYKVCCI